MTMNCAISHNIAIQLIFESITNTFGATKPRLFIAKMRVMALLFAGATLFGTALSGTKNVIPSKEEQANLLTNVQEVFEQVTNLVEIEGNSTDDSVVGDINRIVKRAKDKLALLEDLTTTKMSCSSNSVCMVASKQLVERITEEGATCLDVCVKEASEHITSSSRQLTNTTTGATQRGRHFLDSLYACSRKSSLALIACYKDIITKDVLPVKNTLVGAIEAHKQAHFRAIQIRNTANDCVDSILARYEASLKNILDQALKCT